MAGTPPPWIPPPRTPTTARPRANARTAAPYSPRTSASSSGCLDRPRPPLRVRDLILDRAAVALARVAPVVLGHERRLRTHGRNRRGPNHGRGGALPAVTRAPLVDQATRWFREACARRPPRRVAPHRHRPVRLVVGRARDDGDGSTRHQLAHEGRGAAHLAVRQHAAHVEPQVDLVEIPMQRHGDA